MSLRFPLPPCIRISGHPYNARAFFVLTSVRLYVPVSERLYVRISVRLYVHVSVRLCVRVSVRLYVRVSAGGVRSSVHPGARLSASGTVHSFSSFPVPVPRLSTRKLPTT